jgi:hypothetical protein
VAVEPVAAEEDSKAVVVAVDSTEPVVAAAEVVADSMAAAAVVVEPAVVDNKAVDLDMGLVLDLVDAEPDNSKCLPTP